MNKIIRIAVSAGLVSVALAGCGSTQQVDTGAPAKATTAAAQQESPTTTKAPAGVPLSEITVVGEASTPMSGPMKMDAKIYEDSVYQSLDCGAGFTWVFDLNRSYSKLNATVGYDDNAIAEESSVVTFKGDDGAVIGSVTVSLGKVAPVEINLNGALRLRVEVARQNGGCIAETGYSSRLALGDAMLTRS